MHSYHAFELIHCHRQFNGLNDDWLVRTEKFATTWQEHIITKTNASIIAVCVRFSAEVYALTNVLRRAQNIFQASSIRDHSTAFVELVCQDLVLSHFSYSWTQKHVKQQGRVECGVYRMLSKKAIFDRARLDIFYHTCYQIQHTFCATAKRT